MEDISILINRLIIVMGQVSEQTTAGRIRLTGRNRLQTELSTWMQNYKIEKQETF